MTQPVETTLTEMFESRNYTIVPHEGEQPKNFMMCAKKNDGSQVYVFGVVKEKLSIGFIKECIGYVSEIGCSHFIVVYNTSVTPPVKKLVESTTIIRIELFTADELGYNVTKHVLVPKHEKASDIEYKQLKQYLTKIPRILVTDPVVRFYGFKRGTVVKVTRKTGIILYRIVV